MRVQDASQFAVNVDLAGVTKRYLVYMTQTKLGIPPALLAPYTEGDADYLASLGASLNGYSRLCIDIEYLTTSPATIVWAFDNPVYRAGCVALMVDWIQKFRVGYTGEVGFYAALPDFVEYARHKVEGNGASAENAAYALAYQYAQDMAALVAEVDVLYPSCYLDGYTPGGNVEKSFADRMSMFRTATTTTVQVLQDLYPTKPIELFINRFDLDARLSHLRGTGVTVDVWEGDTASPFTSNEIAVMRYWNEIDNTGSSDMPKKLSEFDDSLEATNPDGTIRIAGADGSSDVFVTVGTLVDRSIHVGQQTLDTIADAGALAAKNTAALSDIDPIAGQSILGNSAVSSAVPGQLTAAQVRTLLNVADGSTNNGATADLLSRANHTGTQPLATVSGLTDALGTIDAYSVTTDALVLDQSGTRYTVAAGADGTGPGGSGRALYVPNVSGTPSYGEVNITSGPIDIEEGETTTVTVNRSLGTSGAVTVTWTVSPGTHTVTDTGTISWITGEGGPKTFTLTGEQVATDLTGGTVTIAVTSGSATEGATDSVTIATRNVVAETPGVMSISGTTPIGESGTTFSVYVDRSTGSDGDVAVDWTCTSGNHTTLLSGTETWVDGNSARHTLTLTRATVSTQTVGTLTLSNARRTDGGSPAPTISGTQSATYFGINPSTNAGTISLVSTAIDEDENTPLPIVLTRAGGSAGEAVARWTITGDTGVDTATGTITWAAGDFGDKSPTVLPVGDLVPVDRTGGVLTVTIVSGSATLLAPVTGTIAVRNVSTEYTVANAIAGLPSSITITPANSPSTANGTVTATTGNISSYITGSQQRRVELSAGSYGNLTITGTDIELVLTTGVTIGELNITSAAARIRVTADPVRTGTITEKITIGNSSAVANDITFDGILQLCTNTGYNVNTDSNTFYVDGFTMINSSLSIRGFLCKGYGGISRDWVIGNNELIDLGYYNSGSYPTAVVATDSGASWRTQGLQRCAFVDNRLKGDPISTNNRQCYRIHAEATNAEDHYVARNQFEGTGHAFQRRSDGVVTGQLVNIHYVNNLQYCSVYTPINVIGNPAEAATYYPTTLTVTGNTLYSSTGDYPTVPSGYTWTVSGNTYTSGTPPTPPTWGFDTWPDWSAATGRPV